MLIEVEGQIVSRQFEVDESGLEGGGGVNFRAVSIFQQVCNYFTGCSNTTNEVNSTK